MNLRPEKLWRAAAWFIFAATLCLVVIARVRLLGIPLERDEGEYAYAGRLILEGIPPYQLAYNMKFPGTYAAYALCMALFGRTIGAVHLGLLVVNLASIAVLFFLGRRLLGTETALAASAVYAVLSALPYTLGLAAHATHFVMLPVLAGALLLLRGEKSPRKAFMFLSGFLLGLGVLMKQPAVCFVIFGSIYLLVTDFRDALSGKTVFYRQVIFLAGAVMPFILACLILWWVGVFGKFWFWTIQYAREYGTAVSPLLGARILKDRLPEVISNAWPLWSFGGVGLIVCSFVRELRPRADFLWLFLLFSFAAVCAGFYFRTHYFIMMLPAISLLAGSAFAGAFQLMPLRWVRFVLLLVFAAALGFPIWTERNFFFERSAADACRMVNGTNPFIEAVKVADYLRDHTSTGDKIAILGSEPEIYFYSQRRSATGYIYMYGLMEPQPFARRMQQEMIQEIEQAQPKYLVLVVNDKSWLVGPNSDRSIFGWGKDYCDAHYRQVGLVNIGEKESDYYFDVPMSAFATEYIVIYERKA